jgi:hypothetical protein
LRRFVGVQPAPAEPVAVQQEIERCEMCAVVVPAEHGHVVDVEHRSLMCACRPCYLLFVKGDNGKYRAVPDRYLIDPELTMSEWQALGLPVGTAFFLRGDSGLAAFYPSPAGATECLLDLDIWSELVQAHPMLGQARPEVEAILIRQNESDVECYLVPIDVCYQLVGTVRVYWKGFDGGQEAREQIAAFFADVQAKAKPSGLGA